MAESVGAFISLGSNEGDRVNWMSRAQELIGISCGDIIKKSSIYETAAWGIKTQPDFLNMVVLVRTSLTASELLAALLAIETQLGRQRIVKWGPRIIDLDILYFGHQITKLPNLVIPHPFLQERRFTLVPLVELAPDYIHPVLHKTNASLLAACEDTLTVRLFS